MVTLCKIGFQSFNDVALIEDNTTQTISLFWVMIILLIFQWKSFTYRHFSTFHSFVIKFSVTQSLIIQPQFLFCRICIHSELSPQQWKLLLSIFTKDFVETNTFLHQLFFLIINILISFDRWKLFKYETCIFCQHTYINKPILIRQHHGYQLATWEKQNCQKYRTFVLSRIILREGESTRYKICQKPTHNLFILLQHYFLIWESGVRSLEFRWWISVVKVRGKIEKKIYYKSIRTFVARL